MEFDQSRIGSNTKGTNGEEIQMANFEMTFEQHWQICSLVLCVNGVSLDIGGQLDFPLFHMTL